MGNFYLKRNEQMVQGFPVNRLAKVENQGVVGPASATDKAIARFSGTTGKLVQNSSVTIDDSTGTMNLLSDSSAIKLGASSDAIIAWDAANTLAQRNGANAQTVRVYQSFTDASNYSRLAISASADTHKVAAQKAGSFGSPSLLLTGWNYLGLGGGNVENWRITSSGHLTAVNDNVYDVGASLTTRPRTGYFGTSLVTGGDLNYGTSGSAAYTAQNTTAATNAARRQFTPTVSLQGKVWDTSTSSSVTAEGLMAVIFSNGINGDFAGVGDALSYAFYATVNNGTRHTIGAFTWNNGKPGFWLGGTSTSFPAIFGGAGTTLQVRLADNSADAPLSAAAQTWSGHSTYATDNTYDIGASGATRPRTIYTGTSIIVGSSTTISSGTLNPGSSGSISFGPGSLITGITDGQIKFTNNAATAGVGFDFGTDGTLKIRNRAQNADATLSAATYIGAIQALSGAGAIDVTNLHTSYTSTGVAQALTLANGTAGQMKTITHVVDGGSGVLTPTTALGYTTITFNVVGDSVTLRYTAQGWAIIGIYGAVAA